ncbi:hypothetical protein DT075_23950 [Bacillus licheniformis]|nr:hypothetical protein DT075_23950 [Bacillus licheniformis]
MSDIYQHFRKDEEPFIDQALEWKRIVAEQYRSFGRVLASLCEPYLEPFRRIIPPLGMIDISPIVAIFVLKFADAGLLAVFRMLGAF